MLKYTLLMPIKFLARQNMFNSIQSIQVVRTQDFEGRLDLQQVFNSPLKHSNNKGYFIC